MKPVRLNRRTVMIVGVGLAAALALGLSQGLRGLGSPTVTSQAQEATQALIRLAEEGR